MAKELYYRMSAPISSSQSIFGTPSHSRSNKYDLEAGDHVVRAVVYPFVHAHGIVMSAVEENITLIDFGLAGTTQSRRQRRLRRKNKNTTEGDGQGEADEIDCIKEKEARRMMESWEKHRDDHNGQKRMSIITLRNEKEIKKWKKYNYQSLENNKEKPLSESSVTDMTSIKSECANTTDGTVKTRSSSQSTIGDESILPKATSTQDYNNENREGVMDKESKTCDETSSSSIVPVTISSDKADANTFQDELSSITAREQPKGTENDNQQQTSEDDDNESLSASKQTGPSTDPFEMVLYRVQFILNNPDIIPKYQFLQSNSECIAVWCKTGRWSTFQTALLLHAATVGNLKGSITVATLAMSAAAMPAEALPATIAAVAGSSYLMPAVAGFTLLYVVTPQIMLRRARKKWEEYTQTLNDAFWSWADPEIYVYAINFWGEHQ